MKWAANEWAGQLWLAYYLFFVVYPCYDWLFTTSFDIFAFWAWFYFALIRCFCNVKIFRDKVLARASMAALPEAQIFNIQNKKYSVAVMLSPHVQAKPVVSDRNHQVAESISSSFIMLTLIYKSFRFLAHSTLGYFFRPMFRNIFIELLNQVRKRSNTFIVILIHYLWSCRIKLRFKAPLSAGVNGN